MTISNVDLVEPQRTISEKESVEHVEQTVSTESSSAETKRQNHDEDSEHEPPVSMSQCSSQA